MSEEYIGTKADEGRVSVGFILFKSDKYDWSALKNSLADRWGIEVDFTLEDDIVVFAVNGMNVACSFVAAPVPGQEAERNAEKNFLWQGAADEVAKHTAHLVLAVLGGEDMIANKTLFTKVAAAILHSANAIGIYQYPTVLPTDYYLHFADSLGEDEAPVPLWVYIGLYPGEDGASGFTLGMADFGFEEIEVLDSDASPMDIYTFLIDVSSYLLTGGQRLKDGDTIGFTEDQRMPVTLSEGVAVEGMSMKIEYTSAENA